MYRFYRPQQYIILKIRVFPLGIWIDKFVKDMNTFVDFIP